MFLSFLSAIPLLLDGLFELLDMFLSFLSAIPLLLDGLFELLDMFLSLPFAIPREELPLFLDATSVLLVF